MNERLLATAPEGELVEAAQRGDLAAFEALARRNEDRAYNVARRLLGHPEDAEDATQEALVRAFRGLRKFSGRAQFGTWLIRIVINVCRTHRCRRSRLPQAWEPELAERPGPAQDPLEPALRENATEAVHSALAELPQKYREVLVLYELEEMSYEEISVVLRRPVGTVRSRLNRARLALRDKLVGKMDLE